MGAAPEGRGLRLALLLLAGAAGLPGYPACAGGPAAVHSNRPPGIWPDLESAQVITNCCSFSYPATGTLYGLNCSVALPAGWKLTSAWGNGSPEISPVDGRIGFPGSLAGNPIVFYYSVEVPPLASAGQSLRTQLSFLLKGSVNPVKIWAEPDPLPLPELPRAFYVSLSGTHRAPFTNWAMAATNIHEAVQAAGAAPDGHVWVSNGLYCLSAPVAVSNGITVRGVHGAARTVLDGGGASRGVSVAHGRAVVYGFTISNCAAEAGAEGGGVRLSQGLVSNCRLLANRAARGGGAAVGAGGILRNCLVSGNAAADSGGGVLFDGGGRLENGTLVSNSAASSGGGLFVAAGTTGTCVNTIVYHNAAESAGSNWAVSAGQRLLFSNGCMAPAAGAGLEAADTIDADPQFLDLPAGGGRLAGSSPCVNAGVNQDWMQDAQDLDGRPRKDRLTGRVDIGAYEHLAGGSVWSLR